MLLLYLLGLNSLTRCCSYYSDNLKRLMCWNESPVIFIWSFRSSNPLPADGFEEILLSRLSHTHSLQQRPGSRTSWGLRHLSAGICRSSLHRGTQVTPPPWQWHSWAQEGWNTWPSSSRLPFNSQPSSFWPDCSTGRKRGREESVKWVKVIGSLQHCSAK